ncbi:MAG: hypothetical protein WD398_13365 [Cyclobacteriaceae bacterium]
MKLLLLIGIMFCSFNVAGAFCSERLKSFAKNSSSFEINPTEKLISSWMEESKNFRLLQKKLSSDFQRFGHSEKMVKNIFYRSHRFIFEEYEQFSTEKEVLESGKFDCVSGSLVLASLLSYYGFDYDIHESSYHVFITVGLGKKEILLEVTDPFGGFINDNLEVDHYMDGIQKEGEEPNLKSPIKGELRSFLSPNIFESIELTNLVGLQYFNLAIKNYNDGHLLVAYQFLTTALKYHDTQRIRDFHQFLKNAIHLMTNPTTVNINHLSTLHNDRSPDQYQ